MPTPAFPLAARRKTEGFIAQRETPGHVGPLRFLLFGRRNIQQRLLGSCGDAAIAAVADPPVAGGVSVTVAMPSGTRFFERALSSFVATLGRI